MELHLALTFPGLPTFHFRAEKAIAETFVAEARRYGITAAITLDSAVSAAMAVLPCRRLFEP